MMSNAQQGNHPPSSLVYARTHSCQNYLLMLSCCIESIQDRGSLCRLSQGICAVFLAAHTPARFATIQLNFGVVLPHLGFSERRLEIQAHVHSLDGILHGLHRSEDNAIDHQVLVIFEQERQIRIVAVRKLLRERKPPSWTLDEWDKVKPNVAARLTFKMESDGVEFEPMYETELRYIVRTYVPHLRTLEEMKDIGLEEYKLSWQSGNDVQGRRAVMEEILKNL